MTNDSNSLIVLVCAVAGALFLAEGASNIKAEYRQWIERRDARMRGMQSPIMSAQTAKPSETTAMSEIVSPKI